MNEIKKDIEGVERFVCGYEDDNLIIEYKLNNVGIDQLRKIFYIDANDPDPVICNLINPLPINQIQAEFLNNYIIDGPIRFNKLSYYLETFQSPDYDWTDGYAREMKDK